MDDGFDEDLATLEALEGLPEQPATPAERKRKERRRKLLLADADLYNGIVAQYGRAVLDALIEGAWTARAFVHLATLIQDDLDLWFEAAGQRVFQFIGAERQALECWLWETHDRQRQDGRRRPNKSPDHDVPWPGAPPSWAGRARPPERFKFTGRYGPWRDYRGRRWFRGDIIKALRKLFPGLPLNPLTISISRALNRERAGVRAELATEVAAEEFHQARDGEWENTSTAPMAERNHPNPQGYWWTKAKDAAPDALIRLLWPTYPRPKWEPCEDEAPRESVLLQTHEPPEDGWIDSSPLNLSRYVDALRLGGRTEPRLTRHNRHYWASVKGRPIGRWSTPKLQELAAAEWRRPLIISRVVPHTVEWISGGVTHGYWSAIARPPPDPRGTRRYRNTEYTVEQSPYEPGPTLIVWPPAKDAQQWAATVPDKRSGAWVLREVEAPADALSAKRKECERRREAAICGLLSNGCA